MMQKVLFDFSDLYCSEFEQHLVTYNFQKKATRWNKISVNL